LIGFGRIYVVFSCRLSSEILYGVGGVGGSPGPWPASMMLRASFHAAMNWQTVERIVFHFPSSLFSPPCRQLFLSASCLNNFQKKPPFRAGRSGGWLEFFGIPAWSQAVP